jgi:DNA-binding transcriptional LysR family regulator
MNITLEHARTLDAFAREGTLQAAAKKLGKGHPSVLYALKQLEHQSGLSLFDRSGYRTRLNSAGEAVLRHCRAMLAAARELEVTCAVLQSGWEPVLQVVFDAIVPLSPFFRLVKNLGSQHAPTKVMLSVDSLMGVETRFEAEQADLIVTVLPTTPASGLSVHALPKLKAKLVAHRSHPLTKMNRLTREELGKHVLFTVRGSDPRLHLATADLDIQSTVHLSDFHAKKSAILSGLGFGWLPDWLIDAELARGEVKALPFPPGAVHTFEPRVVARRPVGKAGNQLIELLTLGV